MSPAPEFLVAFAAAPLAACPMVVGGVICTAAVTATSLAVLAAAPGLMIRQPLARAGSPLASCDYHSVAAPYRARLCALLPPSHRRGAAGRHIAKEAFCAALADMLAILKDDPWAAWEALADRAWRAFSADVGYAAQLAAAGAAARREAPPPALAAAIAPPAAVAV